MEKAPDVVDGGRRVGPVVRFFRLHGMLPLSPPFIGYRPVVRSMKSIKQLPCAEQGMKKKMVHNRLFRAGRPDWESESKCFTMFVLRRKHVKMFFPVSPINGKE